MEKKHTLSDVFGVGRDIPETYVERNKIDDRFLNDLARYKHIVIHGSSKQGKTCLRKYHLSAGDYDVVQCTRNTSKEEIYETVMKFADVGVSSAKTSKSSKGTQVKATIGVEGKIPLLAKAKGGGDISAHSEGSTETTFQSFEIDISNPNDVCRVLDLAGYKKFIILEDFHYLPDNIQESISYDLKAFHDNSPLVFIIIGVWLESNKLVLYNGDLSGRINTITADKWEDQDLIKIIKFGEALLNIQINDDAVVELLSCCHGNVGLLQEMLYRLCEEYGINNTQYENKVIGSGLDVRAVLRFISKEDSPRYINFLSNFSTETNRSKYQISKWIVKFLMHCTPEDLSKGLNIDTIHEYIRKKHPYGFKLTRSNLGEFMSRIDSIQKKYKIQPVILEFSHNFLRIMDVNFIVFLTTHYRQELEELVG